VAGVSDELRHSSSDGPRPQRPRTPPRGRSLSPNQGRAAFAAGRRSRLGVRVGPRPGRSWPELKTVCASPQGRASAPLVKTPRFGVLLSMGHLTHLSQPSGPAGERTKMREGARLAARPSLAGGAAGECNSLRPPLTRCWPCHSNSVCLSSCISRARRARSTDFGLSAGILAAGPVQRVHSSDPPPALRPAFRQTSWPDAERRGVELSPWPASWRRSASGSGSRRSPSHTHWEIEARVAPLSAESLIE
jgi:hypothetical protein